MSKTWRHNLGDGARMVINKDALSDALFKHFEDNVNSTAQRAYRVAQETVPTRAFKVFIAYKSVSETPQSWRRNKDEKSPLLDGLEIPVALVVNDSNYAFIWEYGTPPGGSESDVEQLPTRFRKMYRPLLTALQRVNSENNAIGFKARGG